MWYQRGVLWMLVRRDLAVKYQASVLGYLWSLIDPLVQALIYWFIFGVLYGRGGGPGGPGTYPLYIVSGIFAWMWTNSAITESTKALSSQARLITTMRVRREIFPVGKVIARFAEYLAGIPILILFAIIFHGHFGWSLFALPLALVLQFTLLIGLALALSSLNVLFRDVERIVRLTTRVLLYSQPIIYPISKVMDSHRLPGWVKTVYETNPLVGIMQLHHSLWFPSEFPTSYQLIASAAGALIVFIVGTWIFRATESTVLKEL
ncbi:MAG: ABC transporter permease [Actinocatenispora sp.]